jgi:hypothetical protein
LYQEAAMRTGALLLVLGALATARGADISVPGGILRVEKTSQVRITDGQVELSHGTITYQVRDAGAAQLVEILTPSVSAKATEEGVYRFSIRKTGESEITAQSGRMVVTAPSGEQWLEAGQKMIARGPRGNPQFRLARSVGWWRRLAGMLQNIQIGGGGGASADSGGGDEKTAAAKETHRKPTESAAVPSGSAHAGSDRAKTSDGHSNSGNAGPHAGDSRSSGGSSHAASAPSAGSGGASSSHSSESHAGASASQSNSGSRGK